MNQSVMVSPEAPHMKTADLVNEASENPVECLPVAVGTTVSAGDRGNFGTVVKDLGDSCIVSFKGENGTAEKELHKSLLQANGRPLILASVRKIELKGICDFVKDNPDMREPMIEGLLRRGETANVIASTKVGKSWLSTDLALSIATGTKWLKTYETTKGVVVYIDLELHPETFAERLKYVAEFRGHNLQAMNGNFIPVCLRGTGYDINSLHDVIDQLGEVDLIVLDAWYRLIPEGVNENDNAQMMTMYNKLDEYAKQLNAAIVVIHHSTKGDQGAKRVTDVGSGAGSISRAADTHIVIREHAEEGLSVLNAACRSFPPAKPISMHFTFPCWHVSQTEVALKSRTSQKDVKQEANDAMLIQKIKNAFDSESTFSANDIRALTGSGKDRCARVLSDYGDIFEPAGQREPVRKNAGPQPLFKLKPALNQ